MDCQIKKNPSNKAGSFLWQLTIDRAIVLRSSTLFILFLLQSILQGMPGQDGAFYPGGHVGDIFQGDGVVQFFQFPVIGFFPLDHGQEQIHQTEGFLDGFPPDQVDHDIRGGLADGAAVAGVGGIFDDPVLDIRLEGNVIPAAGIVAMFLEIMGPGCAPE